MNLSAILQRLKDALIKLSALLQSQNSALEGPLNTKDDVFLKWAKAIEKQEGGRPGDRNIRNNNPGNLKYTPYTAWLGATKHDDGNFSIFPTYSVGLEALCKFLKAAVSDQLISYRGEMTLLAFTKIYAEPPTNDYANNVAIALGVSPLTKIKDI